MQLGLTESSVKYGVQLSINLPRLLQQGLQFELIQTIDTEHRSISRDIRLCSVSIPCTFIIVS